ncbi:MAG: nucleoside hydrolase [Candidatus Limnocylindrales bacterium]
MVQPTAGRTPLLIDVDTGIDDALALLYACASPEAELVAVTCVSGNVHAEQVAVNTRSVLALAGRSDVEVALGRTIPLVRELRTAADTHGPRGLGYADLPAPTQPLSNRHAADVIVQEARQRPGELTLVTLGPLTNIAMALYLEPELPRLLKRMVMMAGSYRSAGNTAPTTEWNVAVDPEAMQVVLNAFGAPELTTRPMALGLDVTERAKFVPDHLEHLARRAGCRSDGSGAEGGGTNRVVRFLGDALRFYMEFHSRYDGFYGAYIHDALAIAAALDPTLIKVEAVSVAVELGGTYTTGETVTDWRRTWRRAPNLDVAVEADIATFMTRFQDRVGRLAATRSSVAS